MKATPLSVLLGLLAAGCSSDVDLQLNLEGEHDPPAPAFLDRLGWVRTFLPPVGGSTNAYDAAWAPDGSLVAYVRDNVMVVGSPDINKLGRHAADGKLLSQVVISPTPSDHAGAYSYFTDVELTTGGSALVAGWFYGVTDLGGGPIESGDWQSSFLAEYGAGGELLAAHVIPNIEVFEIVPLPDGGAVVGARDVFTESMFLARFDAGGKSIWRTDLDGSAFPCTLLARGDDLWMSGDEIDEFDRLTPFVARVSLADGSREWLTRFELIGEDSGVGTDRMVMNADGHLLLPGSLSGVMKAGSFVMVSPSAATSEMFVLELDPDGEVVDAREIAAPASLSMGGIALDGDNLAMVGFTEAGIAVDLGQGLVSGGFVAVFDGSGRLVASRGFGQADDFHSVQFPWDVAFAPDGRIAVTGSFFNVADFGDGPVSSGEPPQIAGFVAVYEPDFPSVD
jgi:hypothetical protein